MKTSPRSSIRSLVSFLVVGSLPMAACAGSGDDERESAVDVVAALYPLAYAAERIGGDLVDVVTIAPPGGHAHETEVGTDDVDAIEDADVVLYVEGDLQPAVADVAERQGDRAVAIETEGDDPHFWLDPVELAAAVDRIARAIAAAVPDDRRGDVDARAAALVDELTALDEAFEAGLATCERRSFVTTHAAFGYLARRYDLDQRAVASLAPESEPSPSRIAELADEMREAGITTVFAEDAESEAVAETLAREAGASVAKLSPLESLTDEQVESGEDYVSIMRDNLDALRRALGCS